MAYSKVFIPNEDEFSVDPVNLYQSTFVKSAVLQILTIYTATTNIKITKTQLPNLSFIFVMEFYSNMGRQAMLQAQFPCPDQCVPPVSEQFDFIRYNTFDVIHIYQILSQTGTEFINIQQAKLKTENNETLDSIGAYGLKVQNGKIIAQKNDQDLVFISFSN